MNQDQSQAYKFEAFAHTKCNIPTTLFFFSPLKNDRISTFIGYISLQTYSSIPFPVRITPYYIQLHQNNR